MENQKILQKPKTLGDIKSYNNLDQRKEDVSILTLIMRIQDPDRNEYDLDGNIDMNQSSGSKFFLKNQPKQS